MKNLKTINAPEGANYLSEIKDFEIPVNCIFNKGKTGCGGTELAINQKGHTIIAMPFINLVKNKEMPNERRQYDVLGVHGEVRRDEIIDYANTHDTLKILVTYDSLEKAVNTLYTVGYNVYKDFFLLVDEYHLLFTQYSFRNKAIKRLLEIASNFEHVTYMSATPIEREFILEELKHFPTVIMKWANITEVTVHSRYQKKPIDYVVHLSKQVIEQNRNGNLHFFVNSVEFINKAIKKADLKPEQVKIVCANNLENARKLGADYLIKQASDPIKKVNFYTSTAFEGCDIYDEQGRIYIVSDATKAHTLMDISTLFIQICGRIRNSIYNSDIMHIFSITRYSEDLTLEEYAGRTKQTLNKAVQFADDINQVPDDSRKMMLSKIPYLNEQYVKIEDNRLMVDKNLANIDIVNFKITKQIYKSTITLSDELRRNGFGVSIKNIKVESPAEKVEMNPKAKVSFQELFEEYAKIKEKLSDYSFENAHYKLEVIESTNSLVKEAYEKLGREEVERLKYNQTNIRREIQKKLDIPTEYKIVKMINSCLPFYTAIPNTKIKEKIQNIYNELGVKRTAKATDLNY